MKNKPAKRTIGPAFSVTEWHCGDHFTDRFYSIRTNFEIKKLRKATVQIVGPGKSDIEKRSKLINNVRKVDNKNFMVKLIRLRKKSKKYSIGDQVEIKPKFLKEL